MNQIQRRKKQHINLLHGKCDVLEIGKIKLRFYWDGWLTNWLAICLFECTNSLQFTKMFFCDAKLMRKIDRQHSKYIYICERVPVCLSEWRVNE